MEKIPFPKKRKRIELEELGLDYPGVVFWVWDDPGRQIIADLMLSIAAYQGDEVPTEEEAERFFEAVTHFFIDTNLEGLSFNTIEETMASFDHKDLPWGFLFEVAVLTTAQLITESERLKKVLKVLSDNQDTGSAKQNGEEKLSSE